jgi:large subunit ribosomal protein LP1
LFCVLTPASAHSHFFLVLFDVVYCLLFIQAEVKADSIKKLLEATGNTEVEAFYPIIFANFLKDPETLAKVIAMPRSGGGGGGGGGGGDAGGAAAEEVKEEEKVEEEEVEMGGGAVDMFGSGGGGGGDY